MLVFFCGMLVCALIARAGEASHEYFEARRRQLVARMRAHVRSELRAEAVL